MSSSLTISTDILKFKRLSLDKRLSCYQRKEFIKKINEFPHRDKNKHIIECFISLISDDRLSIDERYSSFSNHIFEKEVLNSVHQFYFHNFHPPRYPLRYKILSAQYLLLNNNRDSIDLRDIYGFLYRLSRDIKYDTSTRAECIDILKRSGYYGNTEFNFEEALNIIPQNTQPVNLLQSRINNLPEPRRRILTLRRTVYEDTQNVHETSINESVKKTIRDLFEEYGKFISRELKTSELNEISKYITTTSKKLSDVVRQKIIGSFDRIMIDTSKFEKDLSLSDILVLVWNKIKSSKDRTELEKRLIEELLEMNGMCATGHLSRIVNVLSGFYEGVVKISFKDQIKNYVFAHYNKFLSISTDSETLLNEMVEEGVDKKQNLLRFIENNNIRDELYKEFVDSKLVSEEDFTEFYKNSVNTYCGIK